MVITVFNKVFLAVWERHLRGCPPPHPPTPAFQWRKLKLDTKWTEFSAGTDCRLFKTTNSFWTNWAAVRKNRPFSFRLMQRQSNSRSNFHYISNSVNKAEFDITFAKTPTPPWCLQGHSKERRETTSFLQQPGAKQIETPGAACIIVLP